MFSTESIRKDRWLLATCMALSLIYLIPFAIGGAYSIDDWLRSDTGNSGWEGNGRPVASIIMAVLSLLPSGLSFFGDNVIQDTYPFSMFFGGAVMVMAGYALKELLEVKSEIIAGIVILLPLTSPYWIGNLEFRHDSLIMSIAFFMAIFSASLFKRNSETCIAWNVLSSICLLTFMLMIYQAALNVYMSVIILIVVMEIKNKTNTKEIIKTVFGSIFAMCFAYAVYSFIINNFVSLSDYTKSHSGIIHLSSDSIDTLKGNISGFISLFSDLNHGIYGLVVLILSSSSIAFFMFGHRNIGSVRSALLVLSVPVTLFLSAGVLILLEYPVITGRVMMGYGVFMCFIVATCFSDKIGIYAGGAIIILNFSFGSITANAISDQQRYDRFMAGQIVSNLYRSGFMNGDIIHVNGITSTPEQALRSMKNTPLLRGYVFSAFSNANFKYSLLRQYGINSKKPSLEQTIVFNKIIANKQPIFRDNSMDIFKFENEYSVFLKRK